MADPITIATVAASALSAVSAVSGGIQQRAAANNERKQYEDQREVARVQAAQQETDRRRELADVLAAQNAIRAGRGVDLVSGTGRSLASNATGDAETDINNIAINAGSQDRQLRLGGQAATARGNAAFWGGVTQGGGGLLSAASALKK